MVSSSAFTFCRASPDSFWVVLARFARTALLWAICSVPAAVSPMVCSMLEVAARWFSTSLRTVIADAAIGLLDKLTEAGCDVPVVLLTGHGDVAHAVRAMQRGAEDFLEKPYDAEHLMSVIERALKTGRLKAEVAETHAEVAAGQLSLPYTAVLNALKQFDPVPDTALMTCLVFNLEKSEHVHFIDGGDGGFAIAAKQLKAQLAGGG